MASTFESRRRGMCATLVGVLLAAFVSGPAGAVSQPSSPPRPSQVAEWAAVRSAYGLSADPAAVAALAGSASDVGSAAWGIPATAGELVSLGLEDRSAFVSAAQERLIPYVRTLTTLGGVWVDQMTGGDIVVQLTQSDASTVNTIMALAPAGRHAVRVQVVQHTEAQLLDALRGLSRSWEARYGAIHLVGAAIDEEANGLSVEIGSGSGTDLSALSHDLSATAGVGVSVREVVAGGDATCTSRDSCYSPMKAGNKVRDGSTSGANWCTQGFLVVKNGTSDVEFLTAGHCAWDGVGNTWYHQAYGYLGAEDGTAYGEDGYDVMKVQFPDAQKSALIYGVSGSQQLTASRSPIQNEGVCFSGAKTNAIVCGTVTAATATRVSQTCGCNVWGGDTNLAPIPGDSGSPLYARVYITGGTPYWLNTPIGIVDHENGYFALVSAAEWVLNVTAYR